MQRDTVAGRLSAAPEPVDIVGQYLPVDVRELRQLVKNQVVV